MARARSTPSPPPVERPIEERSRPSAPVATTALEHAPIVYGYLRRRVSDGPTAERLTQAAFARAGADGAAAVSPAGLVRAAAAILREWHAQTPNRSGDRGPGALDDPAVALFGRALDPDLRVAFNALAPARQRILTVSYLDQLGPAEAAAALDLRPGVFEARLAAAVRALELSCAARPVSEPPATQAVDAA
jgi:DNA-directed RNA polymerase specialized sigma24 family protein